MLQVGAGLTSVTYAARIHVNRAAAELTDTSQRLATLHRINSGRDDPAGLIAAEQLHRDITAAEEALAATERSRVYTRAADSGLSHANALLNEIEANLVTAANGATSPTERDAIQLEIDAAVEALDRIGNTTVAGRRIFSGESASFLVGPDPADQATVDLPAVSSGTLGSDTGSLADLRSGGAASVASGDFGTAVEILRAARDQVNSARAELGSFERNTLDTARTVLGQSITNLASARSEILDADVAVESSRLVQSMVRTDAAVLAAKLTLHASTTAADLLGELVK